MPVENVGAYTLTRAELGRLQPHPRQPMG